MRSIAIARKVLLLSAVLATATLGFGVGVAGAATVDSPPVSASPSVSPLVNPRVSIATASTGRLTALTAQALHQSTLGVMYLWGGGHGTLPAPLASRVDCSGFVREMYYSAFGVDIGSGSGDWMIRLSGRFTRTVAPVPGDVALFGTAGRAPAYHASVYIGVQANGYPAGVAAVATGQPIRIQQWYGSYSQNLMGYWHYNGATPANTSPVQPPVQPAMKGHFDSATGIVGGLVIGGWALDPQRSAAPTTIAVSVDRGAPLILQTSLLRPDVNAAMGSTGQHGIRTAFAAVPGSHTVCLTAQPAGTSSIVADLGCKTAVVPRQVNGVFDRAVGGTLTVVVFGWAFDPNNPAASSTVRLTVDTLVPVTFGAAAARPDVDRALGILGNHGFSGQLAAIPGAHTICATSLPLSATSYEKALGCRVVTVTG